MCDDSFGSTEAIVACRQLGYSSYSRYGSVGTLGLGINISVLNLTGAFT